MPGDDVGAAYVRGTGDCPLRRADVGEIPVTGKGSAEVRIIGKKWPTRGRAIASEGPVVRAAARAGGLQENGEILAESIDAVTRSLLGRRCDRQPFRIGGIQGSQRLGAVSGEDAQPGQLRVPVSAQGKRDQLDDPQAIQRRPRRRLTPQQHKLVRSP